MRKGTKSFNAPLLLCINLMLCCLSLSKINQSKKVIDYLKKRKMNKPSKYETSVRLDVSKRTEVGVEQFLNLDDV